MARTKARVVAPGADSRTLCGWCQGAAEMASTPAGCAQQHAQCPVERYGRPASWCACAAAGHRWDARMAERMASFCRISVDEVYRRHGRTRRVLTDDQRAAAAERLAVARAQRGGGRRG
jgi:hypothetical protein